MTNKTKNYDLFKFRNDNRAKIDKSHVRKITESIKSKNLLEFRPIIVNKNYEILDGQHRFLAAKALDLEIYYQINEELDSYDIVLMNISKSWGIADYLNYYCKQGHEEYIKLEEFIKKNNIQLKVALCITMGDTKAAYHSFKLGNYQFINSEVEKTLEDCWETINIIKKFNGYSPYTNSARFWKALTKMMNHPEFDKEKWIKNLSKLIDRCGARPTQNGYYKMLTDIYNYKNPNSVDFKW